MARETVADISKRLDLLAAEQAEHTAAFDDYLASATAQFNNIVANAAKKMEAMVNEAAKSMQVEAPPAKQEKPLDNPQVEWIEQNGEDFLIMNQAAANTIYMTLGQMQAVIQELAKSQKQR